MINIFDWQSQPYVWEEKKYLINKWLIQWLSVIAPLASWSVTMDDINTMDIRCQGEYLDVKLNYS